jgi:hypothetical protein
MEHFLEARSHGMHWSWDLGRDHSVLARPDAKNMVWQGSLLPSFDWIDSRGSTGYSDAKVIQVKELSQESWILALEWGDRGSGELTCSVESWGIRFSRLSAVWNEPTSIIALYYGTMRMSELQKQKAPSLDRPFWPNWRAEGYGIPCAVSSPTKSFWRSWDMGDSTLPLGSFGDALGTPYAAAFPRPMYAGAMGGKNGWISFGPGSIPDSALSLKLKGATACLQYLYREDLWGSPDTSSREWFEPLRLAWGESAYDAYDRLYQSFPVSGSKDSCHSRSFLCTWGDFKEGIFDLRGFTDRASRSTPADMIVLDDYWESFDGSGKPNFERFPNFDNDLDYMREKGYDIAFWQSIGWVNQPEEAGLTDEDLLCGSDGKPRLWNWSGDPIYSEHYHYCLDPSSPRTRKFLRERTQYIVQQYQPAAFKLDFGYGMPGPDVCAPHDPAFRGERLCAELIQIISEAAKELKPDITIIYYGIHPFLHDHYDMINLDDLGDAGDSPAYEAEGHSQRCMWAALAAGHGMAVNTSTGYYWETLEAILLDTAVVGVNGLTLGVHDRRGKSLNAEQMCRWHAINRWRRNRNGWRPLWLKADTGGMGSEPKLHSWGRQETQGEQMNITALALRQSDTGLCTLPGQLSFVSYTGDWALIAQDDQDLAESQHIACIPFRSGTIALDRSYRFIHVYDYENGEVRLKETINGNGQAKLVLEVHHGQLSSLVGYLLEA